MPLIFMHQSPAKKNNPLSSLTSVLLGVYFSFLQWFSTACESQEPEKRQTDKQAGMGDKTVESRKGQLSQDGCNLILKPHRVFFF